MAAYRDTFRLLLRYLRQKRRRAPESLSLEILTSETVLAFLHHLEQTRGNAIRTRNARLAALRSFISYLADWLGAELPAGTQRILAIPFKRQVKRLVGFLTQPEIEALLAATDEDTWTGRRDHLLILLLVESRARVEAILKRLERAAIDSVALRFRHSTLLSRYATFAELWERGRRAKDEGLAGPFSTRAPSMPPAADRLLHAASFSDPAAEMDRVQALYEALADARRATGEPAVPFHRFAEMVPSRWPISAPKGRWRWRSGSPRRTGRWC